MKVFNQSKHPIEGMPGKNGLPTTIEPGTEGEVDENNPAVKIWLEGNEEAGIEPLLVPASEGRKSKRAASSGESSPDETARVGDKTGTRK